MVRKKGDVPGKYNNNTNIRQSQIQGRKHKNRTRRLIYKSYNSHEPTCAGKQDIKIDTAPSEERRDIHRNIIDFGGFITLL